MKTYGKHICFPIALILVFLVLFAPAGTAGEVRFKIGFSPADTALPIILDAINTAEESIQVAIYSFTSEPIATALLDAHKRGVAVNVIADAGHSKSSYTAVTFLANQGVPVRVDGHSGILHHKFMIIDKIHLETGSFNYSAAAEEKNAENVLLLYDVPDITEIYMQEWPRLWDEAETLNPRY